MCAKYNCMLQNTAAECDTMFQVEQAFSPGKDNCMEKSIYIADPTERKYYIHLHVDFAILLTALQHSSKWGILQVMSLNWNGDTSLRFASLRFATFDSITLLKSIIWRAIRIIRVQRNAMRFAAFHLTLVCAHAAQSMIEITVVCEQERDAKRCKESTTRNEGLKWRRERCVAFVSGGMVCVCCHATGVAAKKRLICVLTAALAECAHLHF